MPPNNPYRKDNKGNIQQDGRRGGHPKNMKAVQNGHGQGSQSDKQDIWKHQSIQIDSFGLDLVLSKHGEEPYEERRKYYS
jgi:hypothetical protein